MLVLKKMGLSRNEYYFQQDNDPKHTALDVKLWILYNTKHLPTPPQSPDINLIENLWAYLDGKVREHNISSKASSKKKYWRKNGTKYHPKNVGDY